MYFFFPSKEIFSLATVIFFFSLKLLNVSSGKLTHPLPYPISLNPVRKDVMFCLRYKTKTMLEIVFFSSLLNRIYRDRGIPSVINKGNFSRHTKNE